MAKIKKEKEERKIVATNRRAFAKYEILESLEAGLVLTGPEVKSLRAGAANLSEGFARIDNGEAFLWNVHISPYSQGSLHVKQDPTRTRKLLLKYKELMNWMGRTTAKGLTIVPLEIYFNRRGKAKVKLALAKGKRGPDRREEIKRREVNRELQREFAGKQKIK
ncbi:MAG: SsrA-binding protein SmpB [Elusimicrobia bacterium]|nr:SsrA-binding protein SmpB [Candidatus Obscuribacterium magneticum]